MKINIVCEDRKYEPIQRVTTYGKHKDTKVRNKDGKFEVIG